MHRSRTWVAAAVVVLVAAGAAAAALAGTMGSSAKAKKPIIIGAAVDLSSNMRPYDSAALRAAQIRAATTKVNGRKFRILTCNTQLDPDKTRACAASLIDRGAIALLVTCDVEFATPATQEAINRGRLALGSCIGTDEQGPNRFGTPG